MQETIFKGATRPPMLWGVPMLFSVGILLPTFVLTLWVGYLVSYWLTPVCPAVGGCIFLWMRRVCAHDDQRLFQRLQAFKLKRVNRSLALYRGLRSYSPYRSHGAQDVWRR